MIEQNLIFTNILTTPNAQLYKSPENLFIIFELNFSHQKKTKTKNKPFLTKKTAGDSNSDHHGRTKADHHGQSLKDKNVIWICSLSVEYPISIFNHLVFFLPSYLTQTRVSFFTKINWKHQIPQILFGLAPFHHLIPERTQNRLKLIDEASCYDFCSIIFFFVCRHLRTLGSLEKSLTETGIKPKISWAWTNFAFH